MQFHKNTCYMCLVLTVIFAAALLTAIAFTVTLIR